MKKLIAILLCLAMLLSLSACEDEATPPEETTVVTTTQTPPQESDPKTEGIKYELRTSDGSTYAEVVGYEGEDVDVVIESTYQGFPVKSIDFYAFSEHYGVDFPLESITIPDSVTSIGDYAFYDCKSLASIVIPDSVTSIDWGAFRGCTSLENVIIGNSVVDIGADVFYGCSSLTSVTIPDSVTYISASAFSGCTRLTRITIPGSVTTIYSSAFSGCESLTSITIPDSVTSIGDMAFFNCNSLTSIVIPDSVTSIGGSAFQYCTSLASITIPFVGATMYGNSNTDFDYIFGTTGHYVPASLKTVVITGGTSINDSAFYNCNSLESITIPDSVRNIGMWAFSGCDNLTSIAIPDSVTSIGDGAFYDCKNLSNVIIGKGVERIRTGAFDDCTRLSRVYYHGAESEWNAISIDFANSKFTSATRYYYSASAPTTAGNYWRYLDGTPTPWEINNIYPLKERFGAPFSALILRVGETDTGL